LIITKETGKVKIIKIKIKNNVKSKKIDKTENKLIKPDLIFVKKFDSVLLMLNKSRGNLSEIKVKNQFNNSKKKSPKFISS
jgi:hypothetical protein